jgi:uncharacterized repeat protein (TIGR01451 family)
MKPLTVPVRLGILAIVCGAGLLLDAGRVTAEDGPPIIAGEPPLHVPPPILPPPPLPPALPPPDCLPTDPPPPVLKVKVRVPACEAPGKPIEYHICVENCSTAEAHHVLLKNPLPPNAKFVRGDPVPEKVGKELQWKLGTVGGGACREVVLVLQPTGLEDVKNCTRVQFEHGVCVTTRQALSPHPGPPLVMPPATGELPTPPMPPAKEPGPKVKPPEKSKLILKIDGHKRQYVNLASHYFITVTNPAPTRAANVIVRCTVPAQLTFDRATQNGRAVADTVEWALGDVEPAGKRTVELVLRAHVEGEFCVRAVGQADADGIAQAERCTQFIGVSALQVSLADRDDPLLVGNQTSYTVSIRNPGSAPVTNLKIKALVPPALKLVGVRGPTTYQLGAQTPQGQWIETAPLANLAPMTSQAYALVVEARLPGETRMRVEVSADQLERGAVLEEESTTLFQDDPPVVVGP